MTYRPSDPILLRLKALRSLVDAYRAKKPKP